MTHYSPAWPHGDLKEVFPDIFFVMGTNITTHEGVKLQHSCNMIVVKDKNALTLINTVRLNDKGLAELDKLGHVTNVLRIGAFHGRHDAFYLDRYQAKLWALHGATHDNQKTTDVELTPNGKMPFPDCSLFIFETANQPEAILHVNREGGLLITCDSVKNWTAIDKFFSEETGELYQKLGFMGEASISKMWLQACNIQADDFAKLQMLTFKHLLSAHGEPLMNVAHERLSSSIARALA